MLTIKNASKTFQPGTPNAHQALKNINLELAAGDFYTVIGSNGAGKSSLFNAITGSFWLDEGRVILDGNDLTFEKEYRRARFIGQIFQDPMKGTAPALTIEENLSLAYSRSNRRSLSLSLHKQDIDFFRETLTRLDMGLENRMKTKVGLLSGGQRQAVTLLMSTLSIPKLLLLDEHTAALDPITAEKVLDITTRIVAENQITTLMITHNIASALALGTHTIMMDSGQIVLTLSGEERKALTVEGLMALYREKVHKELNNDRMLII